jgi:hypothetical protein
MNRVPRINFQFELQCKNVVHVGKLNSNVCKEDSFGWRLPLLTDASSPRILHKEKKSNRLKSEDNRATFHGWSFQLFN